MELAITAVTTIVGAALGAAFQQLFDSVIKAHKKATKFKSIFNELNLTLESYQAFVKCIEQDSNVQPMHGLDAFKVKMEEGIQLVEKGSNIHPLRLKMSCFKSRNVVKLRALDNSLQTLFLTLKMHVDINLRDSKLETLVNRIDQNLLAQRQTGNQIRGWCAVLNPPSFTVGLDEPLNDLKMKLLYNDQVSMLVLTAPGGCGKTTLAQKFCQDKQVQGNVRESYMHYPICSDR